MKLKIEQIDRTKSITFVDKKTGQNKTLPKVGVKSGGIWYSCFQGDWNKAWSEGDEIDVETKQNGTYWNILPPAKPNPAMDKMAERLAVIEEKLDKIYEKLMDKEPF